MSIFTLGFLKGAADRVANTFDAMAEQERQDKLLAEERAYQERMTLQAQEFQAGESKLGRQFQAKESADQRSFSEKMENLRITAQEDLEKTRFFNQLVAQEAQIQDQIKYGPKLAEIETKADRESRQTEMQTIQGQIDKLKPGETAVIPQQFTTFTREEGIVGTGPQGLPRDASKIAEYYSGYTTLAPEVIYNPDTGKVIVNEDSFVRIPTIDPSKLSDESEATVAINAVLQYTKQYIPGWVAAAQQGDDRGLRALEDYMGAFVTPQRLKKLLAAPGTAGIKDGRLAIANPVEIFRIKSRLEGTDAQRWFTEYVGKFLSFTEKNIKQALGHPAQLTMQLKVDANGREYWEGLLPQSYTWALADSDPAAPSPILQQPRIENSIMADSVEMAKTARLVNGNRIFETVGYFQGNKAEKRAKFKELKRLQVRAQTEVTQDPELGSLIFSSKFREDLKGFTSGLTAEQTQEVLRIVLPAAERAQAEGFVLEGGLAKPNTVSYYRNKYGLSLEDVERRLKSAAFGKRTVAEIFTLLKETNAETGAAGNLVVVAGGLRNIVQAGMRFVEDMTSQGVNFQGFDASALMSDLERIQQGIPTAEGATLSKEATTRLLQQLGEQLAFAVAGMLQGGAKGNNISNTDVEAQRQAQAIKSIFASRESAAATAVYYKNFFDNEYATYSRYLSAGRDENEFQAARAYDMLYGQTFNSVDAFLNDINNPLSTNDTDAAKAQRQSFLQGVAEQGTMTTSTGATFNYSNYVN
jgi:hypothetical protein